MIAHGGGILSSLKCVAIVGFVCQCSGKRDIAQSHIALNDSETLADIARHSVLKSSNALQSTFAVAPESEKLWLNASNKEGSPKAPAHDAQPHDAPAHAEHHHVHAHVALFFMAMAIALGALTQWAIDHFAPFLPYSCIVMLWGFLAGYLQGSIITHSDEKPDGTFNIWVHNYSMSYRDSVRMWTEIDPHLLVFVFLPPLLFADCMNIQWHYFKRCFFQCFILAGPGVILTAVMAAAFCKYVFPFGWDWSTCLTVGAILGATDPVAVVAILKSCGVSPKLTAIISGESLINDGSAIVMFNVCFALMIGTKESLSAIEMDGSEGITASDALLYFAKMAGGGPIVGIFFGMFFVWVIGKADKTTVHMNGVVQFALALSCAYLSFFVGEDVLGVSGVLALVVSGIVIGVVGTPRFCDPHGMTHAWHTLEWLLCTLIFILSGVISGNIVCSDMVNTTEVFYFVLCWAVVVVGGRFLTVFLFLPALSRLGYGLSWQGAVVASWGGLRGAVGIALALVVRSELHNDLSIQKGTQGDHIVALACLAAALTLVVNGMSMARLVKMLGLGSAKQEREDVFQQILEQIHGHLTKSIDHAISELPDAKTEEELAQIRTKVSEICQKTAKPIQGATEPVTIDPDAHLPVVRELFLHVLKTYYHEQIKSGQLPKKGREALILQESVDMALDDLSKLSDLDIVLEYCASDSCWMRFLDTIAVLTGRSKMDEQCKCYLLTTFIMAHKHAQKMTTVYIDDYDDVVDAESQAEIARAKEELDKLSKDTVIKVTAVKISREALEKQVHFIEHLKEGGVIDEGHAHHLIEEVQADIQRSAK